MDYSKHFNTRQTSQSEPIPGKKMVENNAGGYVYQISPFQQLLRFLILGSEGNTYYVSEKKMSVDNAKNVIECVKVDGLRTVATLVEVSDSGRAPKNDPAIFALSLAATFGNAETKRAAYQAVTSVCRTPTHLFQYCENMKNLRGLTGSGFQNSVARFYTEKKEDDLAYQLIKYRQRDGWTHKDAILLGHPRANSLIRNDLFRYAMGIENSAANTSAIIGAFEDVQALGNKDIRKTCDLIREYNLPREALPTEVLSSPRVWEALLERMPIHALVRNLGKLGSVGILENNLSDATKTVVGKLSNAESLRKSRMHPLALLNAMKVYGSGHGVKGDMSWPVVKNVTNALENAFYASFGNVTPTGKNFLLGIDVSGSMATGTIAGSQLSPHEAATAMAMVTARTEQNNEMFGFTNNLVKLDISAHDRLEEALKKTRRSDFGRTDCAVPMLVAAQNNWKVDTFVVLTDNETWCGSIHPSQALVKYRRNYNPDAKLAVVGMTATGFSIADPKDSGMMDVVGFDTATPQVISDFAAGNL